jgi:chromosome segregation ATPase
MKPELFLAAATVLAGLGALVFGALRFNREDAKSVVDQQSTLLSDMRSLNDELAEALERCRARKSDIESKLRQTEVAAEYLHAEHRNCEMEIERLSTELGTARAKLKEFGHEQ